jgi:hypothetical protein
MELQAILRWNPTLEASYRQVGALVVNADQPVPAVVDEILAGVGSRLE